MDAVDLIRHGTRSSHAWLENLVSDVTQEQANWQPPGTANSIGATYAHVMLPVDVVLNGVVHRRKPLIASEWAGRAGVGELPPIGQFDEWWPHLRLDWDAFRQYARDVKSSLDDLLIHSRPKNWKKP